MNYILPHTVEVGGVAYPIRYDYRAALDMLTALGDPDLNDRGRAMVLLDIFYPDELPPDELLQEAVEKCLWFLAGGKEKKQGDSGPKVMDWEQDFDLYIPGINHVLGREVREPDCNLHWWSFLSAYMEMPGDNTFGQIVNIRQKKARGLKLDKGEQDFVRRHPDLIEFKRKYTTEEEDLLRAWT